MFRVWLVSWIGSSCWLLLVDQPNVIQYIIIRSSLRALHASGNPSSFSSDERRRQRHSKGLTKCMFSQSYIKWRAEETERQCLLVQHNHLASSPETFLNNLNHRPITRLFSSDTTVNRVGRSLSGSFATKCSRVVESGSLSVSAVVNGTSFCS